MADNKHVLADEDLQYPDWIELYNPSSATVNLAGWSLTDSETHQTRWLFPSTNITAKGFLVVFASSKNRAVPGKPLHTDFNLKAGGEYLALLKPDGSVATEFAPAFPAQYPDISYGLAQDVTTNVLISAGAGAKVLIPANGTLGLSWTQPGFGDSLWLSGPTGVGYETSVAGFAVRNYLSAVGLGDLATARGVISNPAQQLAVYTENAPTINYLNTSSSAHYGGDRTFPGLTIGVDQDWFVVEATATITIPAPGNWTFGVNSDDGFSFTIDGFSMAFSGLRGADDTLQTFNFPTAGEYALDLVFFENYGGSEVELFAAQGAYSTWDSTHFRLVGDTANGGLAVRAPVVSGSGGGSCRPYIKTDVQSRMSGVNASAYIRVPFNVSDPANLHSLFLRMRYNDGFVAYLNGQPVASRNAPGNLQWNSAASLSNPAPPAWTFEEINISDHLNAVVAGQNVLAIQGLNRSAADSDFLILPELVEYISMGQTNKYFSTPTPGALNNSGFIAFVADTKFSTDRGFFDVPFTVAITSATPGATITYTTNGSTPSLANGTVYSAPLTISKTTVLRAAAFKDGFMPSGTDTHTYLCIADIIRQSPNGETPPGWPSSWGANVVDYGMDPDIVNSPAYAPVISNALKSIPTFSIVTDSSNLFDPSTGIYANPGGDGVDWERPASLELIYPDGTKGFQVNAGLRIRGGYSRSTGNPKHAFRVLFRSEYGTGKLQYPLFAHQNGAAESDAFDLRTFENYSWSFEGDYRFIALRDQSARDTSIAQGQPAERGDFYHLYINGQYWGLYNTDERGEASYAANYFGGNKEDYDIVKVDTGTGYTVYATDGNMDAWTRLWMAATNGFTSDAAYFKVQGLNVDGTPNPAYENLLDVDNLIDYMLIVFFNGNIDAPISQFLGNASPNNLYCLRNRTGLYGGFRFLAHDSEHTLLHESTAGGDELHRDRTGPFAAGDPVQQGAATALSKSNPGYLFTRLAANAEFRLRVADHVQKQFFNGGVLTTEGWRGRLLARSNEVYQAIVAESARWGDSKINPPRTRDVDWVTEMKRVGGDYFQNRPGIVLGQLRAKSWFPSVSAPSCNQFGGIISNGFQLVLSAPAGTIYYTRDGSDPRLRGGAISGTAAAYSAPVPLTQSTRLKARTLSGGVWSALVDVTFYVQRNFTGLLITEIMYHPPGSTNLSGSEFEFIELKNVASTNLELSGVRVSGGIDYTFPVGTFLAPGQFMVLASNPAGFTNRYPGVRVGGVYNRRLSNSGDTITLSHVTGVTITSVSYGTRPPWPSTADGAGFSLVPVNPNVNSAPDNPLNWRASTSIGGSPGADDQPSGILPVLVNEALTHTDLPDLDSIELYNPNPTNAVIGNWYLTDDLRVPQKFRIPDGTIIPTNGYIVFTERDWNADPSSSNYFRIDSHGEQIYLFSADAEGNLTGYSDGFSFGAAQNGITFGRYVNSVGDVQYPAQVARTLGGTNAGPRVGPVVINEIHYNPLAGDYEFVELKSVTNAPIKLYHPLYPTNTFRLNGIGYDFPTNLELAPGGLMLVVAVDPAVFRAKYVVPANVTVVGPYPGKLQGGGETLSLQYPDHPDVDTNTGGLYIPYIDMDVVRYDNRAPWPTNADGYGASLERINASAYGNDPGNWRGSAGGPSPGLENNGNRPPLVRAGTDQIVNGTNAPIPVMLGGSATDDGQPNPPGRLTTAWSQVSGPGAAWFSDASQPNTTAWFPGVGTYVLRLTANDGLLSASADVTVTVQHPTTPNAMTFVPKGSVWKYLDDGSDQGTAWQAPGFNDSAWKSGPAPLGYGDANGIWPATTNSFGNDAMKKSITTYYRLNFNVPDAAAVKSLDVSVQRDDGVVVYLNGTPVFTNNMPTDVPINFLTTALNAVGGSDETTFYPQGVDPLLLVNGSNVLAAEIHQANQTSTDIIFDLMLSGESGPPNQGPVVNAGPGQSITLPASALLSGSVSDDGLPLPPGMLAATWTKVSGPGTVTFANPNAPSTTASFSASGAYVLRLAASDGASSSSDTVSVTVNSQAAPFPIESVGLTGDTPPRVRIRFTALAGQSYTVQYCSSLAANAWASLQNVPAPAADQTVEVTDPLIDSGQRFYRVVTPAQP